MRVFCSQCGTANEGQPGTKVMCTNCTSVFEVPGAASFGTAQTVMSGTPPPAAMQTPAPGPSTQPGSPPFSTPTPQNLPTGAPNWGAPAAHPGQPGQLYPAPITQPTTGTNGLAIASLVLGILCCVPIFPLGAVICGGIAMQQLNANPTKGGRGLAIGGLVLGGLGLAFWILAGIGAAVGH